jgi:hypothetical protein
MNYITTIHSSIFVTLTFNSKRLVNGAFGSKYYTNSVIKLNCTGSEVTIKDCQYEEGTCPNRAYNYASVLCAKERIDEQGDFIIL